MGGDEVGGERKVFEAVSSARLPQSRKGAKKIAKGHFHPHLSKGKFLIETFTAVRLCGELHF